MMANNPGILAKATMKYLVLSVPYFKDIGITKKPKNRHNNPEKIEVIKRLSNVIETKIEAIKPIKKTKLKALIHKISNNKNLLLTTVFIDNGKDRTFFLHPDPSSREKVVIRKVPNNNPVNMAIMIRKYFVLLIPEIVGKSIKTIYIGLKDFFIERRSLIIKPNIFFLQYRINKIN